LQHAGASTALETDVYREIVDFQRALVRMYDQQGKAAIFFETAAIGKRVRTPTTGDQLVIQRTRLIFLLLFFYCTCRPSTW
jgi:hypothetical protein